MFKLPNKTYDILVKLQRFLPFVGTTYLALAEIWGLGYGNEVNKTIAVIATLIGVFIEICISSYNKEQINEQRKDNTVGEG